MTTAGTTYQFVERARLRVLALTVKTNYNGERLSVTDQKWKGLWEFTRNVYPIAQDGIIWTTRDELDLSQHNIETDEGKQEVWLGLANLNPPHCQANKNGAGCYDKILGFIPARYGTYPNGTGQGYTMGSPANIIVASDEDAAATVAHEIAHNYAIGDAYDGGSFHCQANPTPDSFSGKDFNTQAPVRCTAGRVALPGVSGTLVPAAHHPYEVGGRGPLGDVAEYMGSGGRQAQFWTSQDAYDWIFDRVPPSGLRASMHVVRTSVLPRPQVGAVASQRLIEFFGWLRRNPSTAADVRVEPWQSFIDDEQPPLADTTGPFMVAAVNAAGARLASSAFDVVFNLPGGKGEPPVSLAEAPFDGAVRFPEGTARFQIISANRVLREIPVSPNAPVVANISFGPGGLVSGERQIIWTASDPDGGPLTYTVEYNPDVTDPNGDFGILIADIDNPRWLENFDDLPGGDHAKLRIVASDGINTGFAETPEFRVAYKAPFVEIDPGDPIVAAGTQITFTGFAEDLLEELPESALVWTSDIAGRLGIGDSISVKNLPVGRHTITLTATNSRRLSGSDSVVVVVGGRIQKVSVSPAQPAPGAPVAIMVEGANPCGAVGLSIDGATQVVRAVTGLPFTETRTFTAGTHTVKAFGHANCVGEATVSFVVK
jgi:hypothetical protein